MTMHHDPQAGDLGFATIAGHVGGWVSLGQMMLHDSCRFTHVFQVVFPVGDPDWPDGLIQEAMPDGMRIRPLAPRLVPGYAYRDLNLIDAQRAMVPAVARTFMPPLAGTTARTPDVWQTRGPGYSFASYLALALAQYRITRALTPDQAVKRYIDRSGRFICSQHVDEFQHRLGNRIFDDGRWRGDATPGDLWYVRDPQIIEPAPAAVDGA
jgi:hypothetical protein